MAGPEDEQGSDQFINIRNQASISLAGNFVDAAISFIGLVVFANVLGADGFGKFYVLLAIVKVCLFPIAGIGQSIMKRGSERGLDPAVFLGGGLTYGGVYALIASVVILTVYLVDSTLLQYSPELVAGAFAVFVSRLVYMLLLDAYRSHGKTGFATLTDNAHGIIETGAQISFILAGFGVMGLLAGTAVTTFAVSAVLLVFSKIKIAKPSLETLRSIKRFARWSVLTSGLGTVYDRLPVLVLGMVLGNAVAGYYTSAMRLLMLGSYVGGAIAPALMVRTSASDSEESGEPDLSDLRISIQYVGVLAIPMMFGSLAIPNALMVTIFGPTFAGTGAVLVGLGIYHVFNTYDTVISSFIDGIDRPDYTTKATTLALLVRVGLIIASISQFGIIGVVASVVISHAIHLGVVQYFLLSHFGQAVFSLGITVQVISAAVMWTVVTNLPTIVEITNWFRLVTIVGIGAMCYTVTLLAIDSQFRDILQSTLREALSQVTHVLGY
ncbi:polysaccharide biosynthesis C-terminal domain-containing protein [Haloarcula sp. AONF1]